MEDDDLRYKFDFTKLSMQEVMDLGLSCMLGQNDARMIPIAHMHLMGFIKKVSKTDPNTVPADMTNIFMREFMEAYEEWMKEIGLIR